MEPSSSWLSSPAAAAVQSQLISSSSTAKPLESEGEKSRNDRDECGRENEKTEQNGGVNNDVEDDLNDFFASL